MLALLLAFHGSAWADTKTVDVHPTAVTVFADRARVTRSASVDLPAGRNEVVFTHLPATTLTTGVTADAQGPGVLRGVDIVRVTAAEIADQRVKEIDDQLVALRDQRQDASDDEAAARVELDAVAQSRAAAAQQLSAQLMLASKAPQQTVALRTQLDTEETASRTRLRQAQQKGRDLDDKISALEREKQTLGSTGTDTYTATVHLDLDKPGHVSVDLSYLVTGASWEPRYDIRGDADKGKVEVALSALVQQGSGEDWDQVVLTVSSAHPDTGATVPTLDPFWLQRPQPRYYPAAPSAGAAPRAAAKTEAAPMEEDREEPEKPMDVAQAAVQVELAATSFQVARKEDVPADYTQRKVLLTTKTLDAKLRWVTVPRLDPRAYLVGEVENTAEFPFLAGQAGVFLSGSYLGDMTMDTVAPGEKFDVAFGVDDHVSVKRTPRKVQQGDTGLVGKRARSTWSWEVRVKNGHAHAIDVVVEEQIPQTSRDDVTVTLQTSTPAPTQKDGGLLDFALNVGAGKEGVVDWGYQVDYPADLSLGWME